MDSIRHSANKTDLHSNSLSYCVEMFEPIPDYTVRNYTHYYIRSPYQLNRTVQIFGYVYANAFIYLLTLVSVGYGLLYSERAQKWKFGRKIQKSVPSYRENVRDLCSSVLSSMIFTLCVALPQGNHWFQQFNVCDLDVHHSWPYAIASAMLILVLHEAYFYWTHRLFHTKWFYDNIHYVHHLARNTTPFSILLLHPVEAMIQGAFYFFTFFFIPTTRQQLVMYYCAMHTQDLYVHLGYEIFPKNWNRHWLGRYLITSVSHNLHHSGRKGKGSYSFYTTFWDKLCGTEIQGYDEVYDKLFEDDTSHEANHHNENGNCITNGKLSNGKAN